MTTPAGPADGPDCPPWCATPAAEHATDDPGAWVHEGPRFGMLRTWWAEGAEHDAFTATLATSLDGDLAADELRALATDALDAAMWMDRQQRTPTHPGRSVVDLVREAHERATRSA